MSGPYTHWIGPIKGHILHDFDRESMRRQIQLYLDGASSTRPLFEVIVDLEDAKANLQDQLNFLENRLETYRKLSERRSNNQRCNCTHCIAIGLLTKNV